MALRERKAQSQLSTGFEDIVAGDAPTLFGPTSSTAGSAVTGVATAALAPVGLGAVPGALKGLVTRRRERGREQAASKMLDELLLDDAQIDELAELSQQDTKLALSRARALFESAGIEATDERLQQFAEEVQNRSIEISRRAPKLSPQRTSLAEQLSTPTDQLRQSFNAPTLTSQLRQRDNRLFT